MATKKRAAKKQATPKTPPQSLDQALILHCMADIDDQTCMEYAQAVFDPNKAKMSEAKRRKLTVAVMKFAVLGWTFYNATKHKDD